MSSPRLSIGDAHRPASRSAAPSGRCPIQSRPNSNPLGAPRRGLFAEPLFWGDLNRAARARTKAGLRVRRGPTVARPLTHGQTGRSRALSSTWPRGRPETRRDGTRRDGTERGQDGTKRRAAEPGTKSGESVDGNRETSGRGINKKEQKAHIRLMLELNPIEHPLSVLNPARLRPGPAGRSSAGVAGRGQDRTGAQVQCGALSAPGQPISGRVIEATSGRPTSGERPGRPAITRSGGRRTWPQGAAGAAAAAAAAAAGVATRVIGH